MQESKKKHIYLIDYLKALAIIMVIITHYEWEDKTTPFFTWVIAMAVPIFMLLMSYNFSMSYERKTNGKLVELYGWRSIMPRLVRFTVPFVLIFVLEMILEYIRGQRFSVGEIAACFVQGGIGPGSYYYPILIQLLFVFPIIYLMVKHLSWLGVAGVIWLNYAYENYVYNNEMELEIYRLLAPRYLLFLAMGCYLYFHLKDKKKYPLPVWILVLEFAVGFSFIVWVYQFQNQSELELFRFWTRTSMLTAFYIFPIVYLLFRCFMDKKITGKTGEMLSEIGKASYHIFLVQMVYFEFFADALVPFNQPVLVSVINIAVCVTVGYGFYLLEKNLHDKSTGTLLPIRIYYKKIRSLVNG